MDTSDIPYLLPYVVSMLTSVYVGVYAWQRRQQPGATAFATATCLQAFMTLGLIFESVASTVEGKLFWDNLQWIPMVFLGVALYEFAIQFTSSPVSQRRIVLQSVPPTVFLIALVFGEWTGAGAIAPRMMPAIPFQVLNYEFSTPMLLIGIYDLLLTLAGTYLLLAYFIRSHTLYRSQMLLIVIGYLITIVFGWIALFIETDIPYGRDSSPFAFVIRNVFITIGVFWYGFLDILPVAHSAIFESMEDGVFVLDNRSRLVDWNPVGSKIIQHPLRIGQPLPSVLSQQVNEDHTGIPGEPSHTEITLAQGILSKPHFYELRISPLLDKRQQKQAGRIVVMRDITARKQAEMERERLITELDAYAHTVAHDLKSPLQVILGYANFLEMQELDAEQRHMVEAIFSTSLKMNSIVDELLTLAKLRQDDSIPLAPLDTSAIIEEVKKRQQVLIKKTNATFYLPAEWLPAIGYAPWVEEIWMNYLDNALKYGGDPPHIHLGSTPEPDGKVRFWIKDNGKGLTPEECKQLFTKGIQLDQSQQRRGHGFVLSIVYRITERLGGYVGVESVVNQGSTFYFVLPAAPD